MAVAVDVLTPRCHRKAEAAVIGRRSLKVVDVDDDVIEEHGNYGVGLKLLNPDPNKLSSLVGHYHIHD